MGFLQLVASLHLCLKIRLVLKFKTLCIHAVIYNPTASLWKVARISSKQRGTSAAVLSSFIVSLLALALSWSASSLGAQNHTIRSLLIPPLAKSSFRSCALMANTTSLCTCSKLANHRKSRAWISSCMGVAPALHSPFMVVTNALSGMTALCGFYYGYSWCWLGSDSPPGALLLRPFKGTYLGLPGGSSEFCFC